jgi:hypothetical protein
MFVQILTKCWLCKFAVNSGGSKSFGPIDFLEFYEAMKAYKNNNPKTALACWIESTKFMEALPPELIVGHDADAFRRVLIAYNSGADEFLDENKEFYLWIEV